jgi:manganese oxidase
MYCPRLSCVALLALTLLNGHASAAGSTEIAINDNRQAAGVLDNGVLRMQLVAGEGFWYPEGKDGPGLLVQAFGEQGKALSIPGPLVRVREGTRIRIRIRNDLSLPLRIHGLQARPSSAAASVSIGPGLTHEFDFLAGVAGTYFYYGATMQGDVVSGRPLYKDAMLSGAFIVDPAKGAIEDDRVFMIGIWHDRPELDERIRNTALSVEERTQAATQQRIADTINGLSWPFNSELVYKQNERVRWRWINASRLHHPMHLHGFYFDVLSQGDGGRESVYSEAERPHVVTQRLSPGGTMLIEWTPERAGNWLFHCHMLVHMGPRHRLRPKAPATQAHAEGHDPREDMSGLVLGLRVLPTQPRVVASHPEHRRQLSLYVQEQSGRFGPHPALGYQLTDGHTQALPNTVSIPGPTIVLTRDEPVSINIISRLKEPTSVHWHGIELDSYFDGVPGWGGHPGSVTPVIAPGESFTAEMTPPRAGTFIYHTHSHDDRQLVSGMYGALLVLEPGQRHEPDRDRLLILSTAGPTPRGIPAPERPILLNGAEQPDLGVLQAGQLYRLRLINITSDNAAFSMHLLSGNDHLQWRPIAKDGATLPPAQAMLRETHQAVSVGETYDFEFRAEKPGELRMEVRNGRGATRMSVPIRVL